MNTKRKGAEDVPVSMGDGERKRLGYWLSEKKCKKLSFADIESALRKRNIEPVKIDLEKPLESQGPFQGILHKLTDFIALAELGDLSAKKLIRRFEEYLQDNPDTIVMDSIECLQTLINRYKTYCVIAESQLFNQETVVFIPSFVELQSNDFQNNIKLLHQSSIKFPAVCKPVVAHGSSSAHQMTLIFNEDGLKEISYPCVVQTFINHNATLYKLFCLGHRYTTVLRPSIKDFHDFEGMAPIQFDGDDISKPNPKPTSDLAIQGSFASNGHLQKEPSPKLLSSIVKAVGDCMGLRLFGVDVIVEASTGRLAVVDVNAFPGTLRQHEIFSYWYEGVTDFPERLADFVLEELDKPSRRIIHNTSTLDSENKIKCNGVTDVETQSITSERLT